VFDKAIKVFFLTKPSDDTTYQEKTIVGNRSSCILITDPVYRRKTINSIPISLILMLNAKIGNSFDVAQGAFDSLAMLGA